MRTVFLGRLVPLVLAVGVVQSLAIVGAAAVSGTDYDTFDVVTLNDVTATGSEVPHVGAAREFFSGEFDTSTFTLQPEERGSAGGLHGCLTPSGPVYAGRTGWVRFDPGSDGRIEVVAETPGYDSVLLVRSAPESAWRTTGLPQLESASACVDRSAGPGNETVSGVPVAGDRVYYVQVGGRCGGDASTCQDQATPGGPTLVRLRFTPHDADGDGVADAQDGCEGQGVAGRVTVDGCPDADLDGIADGVDSCPRVAGVPAAAPYNGCPDGPRPPDPSSTPFLRIESRQTDDRGSAPDPYSTASRKVDLHLNWPKGAVSALIRNRGGKVRRIRELADVVPWRLPRTKHPRVREVRVRFEGPRIPDLDVGDTIIFDPTRPEVEASLVLEFSQGWYVGLNLADRGTGIRSLSLLDAAKQPIPDQEEVLCTPDAGEEQVVCNDEEDVALSVAFREPAYVEVVDVTGNSIVVALEKVGAAKCATPNSEPLAYRDSLTGWRCVTLREPCRRLKPLLIWEKSDVRCRRVASGIMQVVRAG